MVKIKSTQMQSMVDKILNRQLKIKQHDHHW